MLPKTNETANLHRMFGIARFIHPTSWIVLQVELILYVHGRYVVRVMGDVAVLGPLGPFMAHHPLCGTVQYQKWV